MRTFLLGIFLTAALAFNKPAIAQWSSEACPMTPPPLSSANSTIGTESALNPNMMWVYDKNIGWYMQQDQKCPGCPCLQCPRCPRYPCPPCRRRPPQYRSPQQSVPILGIYLFNLDLGLRVQPRYRYPQCPGCPCLRCPRYPCPPKCDF